MDQCVCIYAAFDNGSIAIHAIKMVISETNVTEQHEGLELEPMDSRLRLAGKGGRLTTEKVI